MVSEAILLLSFAKHRPNSKNLNCGTLRMTQFRAYPWQTKRHPKLAMVEFFQNSREMEGEENYDS